MRDAGDFAGVFERDDETSYFYLYDLNSLPNKKILGVIQIQHDIFENPSSVIAVRWDNSQSQVALIYKGNAIAMFNVLDGIGYGSAFTPMLLTPIPPDQRFS